MTQPRANVKITFSDVEVPTSDPRIAMRGPWWMWGVLLALIAIVPFTPALGGSFLPQDNVNLTENPLLRAWAGLRGIWRFAYNLPQFSPLGYSLLIFEFRLWSDRFAAGYQLVSILLHIVNVLLLWTLLRKLDLYGAFIAAAIFAAHPVQVQTVVWISQQPTLLAVALGLLFLIVYLRHCGVNRAPDEITSWMHLPQRPWVLYAIACICFVLALLARPAMAVLPLVALTIIWWERGRITKKDIVPLVPFLAIALLTLVGGIVVYRRSGEINAQNVAVWERILIAGPALWFYLFELIRPGTHSFVYTRWNPAAWWNGLFILAAAGVMAGLWFKRQRIGRGPFAAALLFVLLLLPQILFVDTRQLRDSFVADSVMYAAAAAMIVPLTAMIAELLLPRGREMTPRMPAPWIALACILLCAGLSIRVALPYRDAEKLWTASIERTPNSTYARNELASMLLKDQRPAEAHKHLLAALEIDRKSSVTHRNLGMYYELSRDRDAAYREYFAALEIDPGDVDARCGKARILAAKGDNRGAIAEFNQALADRPDYEIALNDLAELYFESGRYDDAIATFKRGIQAHPGYIAFRINLANRYLALGKFQESFDTLISAHSVDPRSYIVQVNLGAMCGKFSALSTNPVEKKEYLAQSEVFFRGALYLNPDSADAAHNLAVALVEQARKYPDLSSKLRESVFYFNKACMLAPENREYRQHLQDIKREVERAPS